MYTEIDEAKALELLELVVSQAGVDYVDPLAAAHELCMYVYPTPGNIEDGVSRCVVGAILHEAGVDDEKLYAMNEEGHSSRLVNGLPDMTFGAKTVLVDAQTLSDLGFTWGGVLAYVKAKHSKVDE